MKHEQEEMGGLGQEERGSVGFEIEVDGVHAIHWRLLLGLNGIHDFNEYTFLIIVWGGIHILSHTLSANRILT